MKLEVRRPENKSINPINPPETNFYTEPFTSLNTLVAIESVGLQRPRAYRQQNSVLSQP